MDLAIDFNPFKDQNGKIKSSTDRASMMSEFPDLRSPAIIAVMGLPYTGVDSVCRMISEWAGGPVYDTKGPLDILSREQGYTWDHPPANEEEVARLHKVSFDVVCQMASYMYSWLDHYGQAKCLVISSTCVDYKHQLDQLVDFTALTNEMEYKPRGFLLIIECQSRNWFRWQRRVERDLRSKRIIDFHTMRVVPKKWYEPTSWKDLEDVALKQLHGSNDDHFLALSSSHPRLRKLLVDPFEDISDNIITPTKGVPGYSLLFSEAIKYILSRYYVRPNNRVLDYAIWRRKYLENSSLASRITTNHHMCRPGDCIFRLANNLKNECAICYVCDQKVARSERGYYCQFCSLSFHESCGIDTIPHPPRFQVINSYVRDIALFKETYACYNCLEKGLGFSKTCAPCIFRTFIKSRLLPIVMRHIGDDHMLSFRYYYAGDVGEDASSSADSHYKCKACGKMGFLTSYCCNICKSQFHLHCLELPIRTKSIATQHGGHEHDMKIEFSCVEEEEYEWCLICCRNIDPQTWVYTCQECDFVAHIYCLYPPIRSWTNTFRDIYRYFGFRDSFDEQLVYVSDVAKFTRS